MTSNETKSCRLLTSKESANYLAISERKLWSMSKAGGIPVVRFGRAVRYDVTDLDEFIQQAKTGATAGKIPLFEWEPKQ